MEPKADIMTADEETQKKVVAQFEAVRRSGLTNMYDSNMVGQIANENEFYELVTAIGDGMYGSILKNYNELMSRITSAEVPDMSFSGGNYEEEGSRKEVEKAVDKLLDKEE